MTSQDRRRLLYFPSVDVGGCLSDVGVVEFSERAEKESGLHMQSHVAAVVWVEDIGNDLGYR